MIVIQYIAIAGSMIFLLFVLWAIYRGWMREGYSLLWLAISCGMILLSVAPKLLNFIAEIVEIQTPAFVLLVFMIGGMLLLLFQISVIISRHNEKIKHLTEEFALLKNECKNKSQTK